MRVAAKMASHNFATLSLSFGNTLSAHGLLGAATIDQLFLSVFKQLRQCVTFSSTVFWNVEINFGSIPFKLSGF